MELYNCYLLKTMFLVKIIWCVRAVFRNVGLFYICYLMYNCDLQVFDLNSSLHISILEFTKNLRIFYLAHTKLHEI